MMERKVFGVGWAKTGTTTLGECLRGLGYKHRGGRLDLVDNWSSGDLRSLYKVARKHDSTEDWPWLLMFRELDDWFPGSRFVLTTRNPESWLKSYRNMLVGLTGDKKDQRRRNLLYGMDVAVASDGQLLERVEQHNGAVRRYFENRPHDLLEVDWASGDSWPELCEFLGHSIPDVPFPHANRGAYSAAGVRGGGVGSLIRATAHRVFRG